MANKTGKGTFQKGDPRINRKGKPRDFQAFRELGQQIANEVLTDKDGKPVVIDGHIVTVAEGILRKWSRSNDPKLQIAFIEVAYGKTPTQTEITGANGGPLQHQVFDHTAATAAIARRSGGNRNAPGADEDNRDGA